jgi:DNA modification methylase
MKIPENLLNQIVNLDVLEFLKLLPDESVDFVYGDPDYNVGINYAGKNYSKKWQDYLNWYQQLAKESLRVLKKSGNLFFLNYPKWNKKKNLHTTSINVIIVTTSGYRTEQYNPPNNRPHSEVIWLELP